MGLGRKALAGAALLGLDLRKLARAVPGLVWFFGQKRAFEAKLAGSSDHSFARGRTWPMIFDRFEQGGTATGMYFHQDLIAAQLIYAARPARHVDVGSLVEGFVAHVAVFCPVEVIDIRQIAAKARNITFRQADIMEAHAELENYTDSLSCLNALEHFGLGRYGDPLDPDGHQRGLAGLARMVRPGGAFYFSVPIGSRQRVEFNAHRVFAIPYLLGLLGEHGFDVVSFHYVDDNGDLEAFVDHTSPAAARSFDLNFGCGIFELRKRSR